MSHSVHYSYLNDLGIPVNYLVRKSKKDPLIFLKLYKLLKAIQPDLIHSWNSMCSIYALPLAKLLGIKFVNGFLRNVPPYFSITHPEWVRSRLSFPFSDAIVANTQAGLRAYKCPPHKSFYIHNGFDFSRLGNGDSNTAKRKQLGISTEFVVGMVASFSNRKDYFAFTDAAICILNTRRDVTFLGIGDGEFRESCIKRVPAEYENYILFPGELQRVEPVIELFSIGVLCSNALVHGEGISNSIMEYMALAKPVVATDCPGNRELVVHGQSGYLVKNNDLDTLTRQITHLLDHKSQAIRFGECGRRRLEAAFSLERMTQDHITLYRRLVDQPQA